MQATEAPSEAALEAAAAALPAQVRVRRDRFPLKVIKDTGGQGAREA